MKYVRKHVLFDLYELKFGVFRLIMAWNCWLVVFGMRIGFFR